MLRTVQASFQAARPVLDFFRPKAGTMVVLPSHNIPSAELAEIKGYHRYEERLLFLLLALRRPEVSVVFLSGFPIDEAIVDHYLGLLPDPAGARRRLRVIVAGARPDGRPLARRILDDPALCRRIAAAAGPDAWLLPFVVGPEEERLSEVTGLPLYGPPAALARLGTKTGARHVAARSGVATVPGVDGLRDIGDVHQAARRLCGPLMIKLDDGYGGLGCVVVPVLPPGTALTEAPARFMMPGETWESFTA
jgi:hypothetical protein